MQNQNPRSVITKEEILHIASLCCIGLTKDDLDKLTGELSSILDLFTSINGADTSNIPTTWNPSSSKVDLREDTSVMSMPVQQTLANAPRLEGDYLRINVVLEE